MAVAHSNQNSYSNQNGFRRKLLSLAFGTVSGFALMDGAEARQAESYVVLDGQGQIIHGQNKDSVIIPASTVKLMTSFILLERVQEGIVDLDSKIQVTDRRLNADERQLGLKPGTEITVSQALDMMLIHSANDAAISVAETIAYMDKGERNEEAFVQIMNDKAYELGMHDTTFANSTGLDVPVNISTPIDMAYLSYHFVTKFPELFDGEEDVPDYTSGRAFRWNNEPHYNTNALVQVGTIKHRGIEFNVDGLKTGWLRQAGSCVLASGTSVNPSTGNETRLFISYFGGATGAERNSRVVNLFSSGFKISFENENEETRRLRREMFREPLRAQIREKTRQELIKSAPSDLVIR